MRKLILATAAVVALTGSACQRQQEQQEPASEDVLGTEPGAEQQEAAPMGESPQDQQRLDEGTGTQESVQPQGDMSEPATGAADEAEQGM